MKFLTRQTFSLYLSHARRYTLFGVLAVFAVSFASVINMIIPIYYKKFFDTLTHASSANDDIAGLLFSILGIIALFLVLQRIIWQSSGILVSQFTGRIMADLANTCFSYLHKNSFTFFNNSFVGSLVKQVNYFVRAFDVITDHIIFDLLQLSVNLSVILVVLTTRSPALGIVLFVWAVIFLMINLLLTKYKLKYDIARSAAETTSTGILADTITNNSNVKLFCGYDRERRFFGDAIARVQQLRIFSWTLGNIVDGVQGLLAIALEIGMFYVAIRLWQQGRLTVGDFVLIQAYLITTFDRLWNFGKHIRVIYENLADAEDMTKILTTHHEIVDTPKAKTLKVTAGAVDYVNVQFNYRETRTILSKFSLSIRPHEKLALVGPSGAGKSTVVKLLLRMHDVTKGKITIDGQDIAKVTQESLWRAISLVPQEPILFHRTLLENIRYGKPEATNDEVMRAAKLAHCHEFISELPEGYDTYVGERGIKLSGGERQRVAIARAILRNAPLLVLDEATSSLDSESEQLIQEALATLMEGKTVIVIAHRLSTIMKMDRIVVIDRGEIIEEGTHEALLEKEQGLYKNLWQIQAGGFIE